MIEDGIDCMPCTQSGVYLWSMIDDKVTKIADIYTRRPGGTDRRDRLSQFNGPALHNGKVVFQASTVGGAGIYLWDPDGLTKVADTQTLKSDGTGLFPSFARSATINGNSIGFSAEGIYTSDRNTFRTIADYSTRIPGTTDEAFASFSDNVTIYNDQVAFAGMSGSGRQGLYFHDGQQIQPIIDTVEGKLDGRTPSSLALRIQSFSDSRLAFQANFPGFDSGIYVANLGAGGTGLPPKSSLARMQRLRIKGAGDFQHLVFNYSTGALSVSPYSSAPGRVFYNYPQVNEWLGFFHYDYDTGRFTQAQYTTRDVLRR